MTDAAARAAEEIAGQDWMDAEYTTPEMMAASRASIACIIREEYAERDAAVAELIDCVESALRCSELRCPTCKCELNGALMNLAALEGK